MISDEHIKKFQELYFTHFGVHLDKTEAYEKAHKLIRCIQLIYKPIPENTMEKVKDFLAKNKDLPNK